VRRRPLLALALGVLALVFVFTWVFGQYSDVACVDAFPGVPEGTAIQDKPGVWPPGGKCNYELPNGATVTRDRGLPEFEWIVLAVCAGVAWLFSAGWHRLRRRWESPPPESNRQPLHYK
jgi:hypothetical protein